MASQQVNAAKLKSAGTNLTNLASKMKSEMNEELTTEEKIIAAARKLFMHKGFSATRTRDIADEAGINLALLNYS